MKAKEDLKLKIYLDKILNNKLIDNMFNGIYFFHKSGIMRLTEELLIKIAMCVAFLFGIYLSVGAAMTKVIEHKSPISFIASQINPIFEEKSVHNIISNILLFLTVYFFIQIIFMFLKIYKDRTLNEE